MPDFFKRKRIFYIKSTTFATIITIISIITKDKKLILANY